MRLLSYFCFALKFTQIFNIISFCIDSIVLESHYDCPDSVDVESPNGVDSVCEIYFKGTVQRDLYGWKWYQPIGLSLGGEAPRFSADFVCPLSSERPFKFPRHLERALEINGIIAMSDKNIRSAIFNWHGHVNGNGHETDMETETDTETDMETDTETDMDTDMELEYFCWISIRRYSRYCAVWIAFDTSRRKFQ